MFKWENKQIFAILSFSYCLLLALFFEPITWQAHGDAAAYIELAKQFLHTTTENIDLSHRQPLYSGILAIAIFIFGEDGFLYPVMYFQFFLVFISSILVYKIFARFRASIIFPMIVGIAYLVNFSTLYYGYNILSETISLFLFVLIIHLIFVFEEKNNLWILGLLGIMNGLMVLSRFNTIGVPFISLFCISLIHYRNFNFTNFRVYIGYAIAYILPLLFVLNIWCCYNYFNRGFFGLFPSSNIEQRWAIPASINRNNVVSIEYKPILEIFLRAKEEYFKVYFATNTSSGSLSDNKFLKQIYKSISPEVNGYSLYKIAKKELLLNFKLRECPEDIAKLGSLLRPFYSEIKNQNTLILIKYRFFSFVSSFRASGTALPTKEKINLNYLPSFVFKAYKIMFIGIALVSYILTGGYLVAIIWRKGVGVKIGLFIISLFLWYFPLIHFYANVLGDATRFKFPAEPLIFGIFFYYLYEFVYWIGVVRKG